MLAALGRLSQGKPDSPSLLRATSILPLAAGGNPAVPGPRESNKRSDQTAALQPTAPG